MIRVRFAPSPTGHLHIGGVRTALFNFLYARANEGGKFLLRIEDTDRERSRDIFTQEILESMKWLGLQWDEEIVTQSKRLARYKEVAGELIKKDLAYEEKADACLPDRQGKTAVKFRMPKKKVIFQDLVHGDVEFDTTAFEDLVIMKSDGFPTYHMGCIIDDHDMEISHVIRGDDHLSNTPRQILLFEAMGWKPPKYAHLPLILGTDGTPLSKRHGAVSLKNYRDLGYLPDALLNYLALLGWGPKDNQEFFVLSELCLKFTLKRVNKANTHFDLQKLDWLNAQHIKKLPENEYVKAITEYYGETAKKFPPETWKRLVLLYRSRITNFSKLMDEASYFFNEVEKYDPALHDEFLKNRSLKAHLGAWLDKATELDEFQPHSKMEQFTRDVAEGWGIEARDLIHPLRFALTGKTVSPGLFELMSVLGKDTCLKRVKKFLGK